MKKYFMTIMIGVLLSACALIRSQSQVPSTKVFEVQNMTGLNQGTDLPETAAVTFERTGGLAGKTVQWSIFLDGRVISDQGTAQVVPADVSQLVADLKSQGILDLKDSYGRFSDCKDCFSYTITINVDNQTKTITTTEGATDNPAELVKILTLINSFINKTFPQ